MGQKRKELVEKLKKFEEGRGISEGSETEGRKLLIDKEEKVIWKREEEVFMKLEILKRRDSLEEEEEEDRVRKGTIIPNFRFREPERNNVGGNGQDRGQGNRNSIDYRVGLSARVPESKPDPKPMSKLAPRFEDYTHTHTLLQRINWF
ncbi:uncharacterized protein A4U43_C04F20580 [Asparagus officinalis]|uniref:Uncharacterized protein n=1 Tax=Asparagus officinalis TaxID=4686 RepID=A0A5P1F750_ASPOF|nr:uncharacterized protein A4U43_C04F20580 [Asparagus officinalis]